MMTLLYTETDKTNSTTDEASDTKTNLFKTLMGFISTQAYVLSQEKAIEHTLHSRQILRIRLTDDGLPGL